MPTIVSRAAMSRTGRLLPWVPVAFSVGIALYFTADHEPVGWITAIAAVVLSAAAFLTRRQKIFPVAVMVAATACGFATATWRTAYVAHGVALSPGSAARLYSNA